MQKIDNRTEQFSTKWFGIIWRRKKYWFCMSKK